MSYVKNFSSIVRNSLECVLAKGTRYFIFFFLGQYVVNLKGPIAYTNEEKLKLFGPVTGVLTVCTDSVPNAGRDTQHVSEETAVPPDDSSPAKPSPRRGITSL